MSTLTFETKAAVIAFLIEISRLDQAKDGKTFSPAGTYYLKHGEYSSPDYSPRRYKDGWGIHVDWHFYSGTFYAPQSGRVDPEYFANKYLID